MFHLNEIHVQNLLFDFVQYLNELLISLVDHEMLLTLVKSLVLYDKNYHIQLNILLITIKIRINELSLC